MMMMKRKRKRKRRRKRKGGRPTLGPLDQIEDLSHVRQEPMNKPPRSAYDKTCGIMYFARMLDKIRLYASAELRPDFHANLGKGADGWCTSFLRIDYNSLRERVLTGGSDEEIFAWCQEVGRKLNDTDLLVWNSFIAKLGWNDLASPRLRKFKESSALGDRDDIQTMAEYFEVDEGRKP
jgi:Domain of unknown function (DUF5069)